MTLLEECEVACETLIAENEKLKAEVEKLKTQNTYLTESREAIDDQLVDIYEELVKGCRFGAVICIGDDDTRIGSDLIAFIRGARSRMSLLTALIANPPADCAVPTQVIDEKSPCRAHKIERKGGLFSGWHCLACGEEST